MKESGRLQAEGLRSTGEGLASAITNFSEGLQHRKTDKRTQEMHNAELQRAEREAQTHGLEKERMERINREGKAEEDYKNAFGPDGKTTNRHRNYQRSDKEADLRLAGTEEQNTGQRLTNDRTRKELASFGKKTPEEVKTEELGKMDQYLYDVNDPNLPEADKAEATAAAKQIAAKYNLSPQEVASRGRQSARKYGSDVASAKTTRNVTLSTDPTYQNANAHIETANKLQRKLAGLSQAVDDFRNKADTGYFKNTAEEDAAMAKIVSYIPEKAEALSEVANAKTGTKSARAVRYLEAERDNLKEQIEVAKAAAGDIRELGRPVAILEDALKTLDLKIQAIKGGSAKKGWLQNAKESVFGGSEEVNDDSPL